MKREIVNEVDVENVVGGSIVFNGDHTTCGRNCNDEYKVLNYDAAISYIAKNCSSMTERKMLSNMEDAGYIKKF